MSRDIDLLPELRAHVARKYRRQRFAAEAWGVSTAFVSAVLTGRKSPTQQILDDAGIVRTISYQWRQP